MFTGIIQELAQVSDITVSSFGKKIIINRPESFSGIVIGESIALNGVCLTVASYTNENILFDVVQETLDKTNIQVLNIGHAVNLERCMKLNSRIEGHIVQGHVESTATIVDHKRAAGSSELFIAVNDEILRYCIHKGSITIDGVSLTIADIKKNIISIALIPHTLSCTNLGSKDKGDYVNIETDVLGRYIDHFLNLNSNNNPSDYFIEKLK
tara:strand:- start:381 stop:1013 length:633 start_codon:yes stop_codon:yes gene_type:complete